MTDKRPATRCIVFSCDGESLVGILHEPVARSSDVGIVIVVGGPQYRVGSHRQFVLSARSFADAGNPVLRFDVRGMGDSTGSPAGFLTTRGDISAAIDALLAAVPTIRHVCLYGLCDGASAAVLYGHIDPRVTRLVLVNPWVRTEGGEAKTILRHYYWQRVQQREFWKKTFSGRLDWQASLGGARRAIAKLVQVKAGRTAESTGSGGDYVDNMAFALRQFRGRVLILLSGNDLTAREFDVVCGSRQVWKEAVMRANVKVERISNADHTFSTFSDLDLADNIVEDWLAS